MMFMFFFFFFFPFLQLSTCRDPNLRANIGLIMRTPLYKTVSRNSVASYARASELSSSFQELTKRPFIQYATSNAQNEFDEPYHALDRLNLDALFPSLRGHELCEIEIIPLSAIRYMEQGHPKAFERIEHLPDLIDFQLMENYGSSVDDHKQNVLPLDISPKPCEADLTNEDTSDWLADTITIGHPNETVEQHKDVIKSLLRMEQHVMNAQCAKMDNAEPGVGFYSLDPPLLPFMETFDANRFLDSFGDLLDSEAILADLDLSEETIIPPTEARNSVTNTNNDALAFLDSREDGSQFQLDLPELVEPPSISNYLSGPAALSALVSQSQSKSWTKSPSPEAGTESNFVDEIFWQESVSKTSLLRLPLPAVEKTCLQTRISPELPKFEFPEWKISYAVVCSMNWTPFSTIDENTEDDMSELLKYKDNARIIESKYTTTQKDQIFKPIEPCQNILDFSLIEKTPNTIIFTPKQAKPGSPQRKPSLSPNPISAQSASRIVQLDVDLDLISSDDSEIEVIGTDSRILDQSFLIDTNISAFEGFSGAYGSTDSRASQNQAEERNRAPKRKIETLLEDLTDDFDVGFETIDYMASSSSALLKPKAPDRISGIINILDDEEEGENNNSDEEETDDGIWSSIDAVIAKRKEAISMPQSSTRPQPMDLLSFSPYFNLPDPLLSTGTPLNSKKSVLNNRSALAEENTGSLSFLSNSSSASSNRNAMDNSDDTVIVVWPAPVVSPNSVSSSRVVVNTTITPLRILRLFQAKHCAVEAIEADLGGAEDRDGLYAANFYLSHQACIVLFSLIEISQVSPNGELKAITKLKSLKATIDLLFVIILIDHQSATSSSLISSSSVLVPQNTKADEKNLRAFQVTISKLPWLQSFVIQSTDKSSQNLPNFVAHLANIHGTEIPVDLFSNTAKAPLRSIQFLKLCGINCVAAAMLLRDTNLLELIQMSPAYFAIKYGDLVSQEQQV